MPPTPTAVHKPKIFTPSLKVASAPRAEAWVSRSIALPNRMGSRKGTAANPRLAKVRPSASPRTGLSRPSTRP